MRYLVIGANHRTAPVELRERLAFANDEINPALDEIVDRSSVDEALIVSTCNRVEILASGDEPERALDRIHYFLASSRRIDVERLNGHVYRRVDREAVHHVFRVAASLDSLVVGEPQILGQVREAYQAALDAGTVGKHLSSLMQSTFAVAKRVRSETAIGASAVSVSYVAVELGKKIFGSVANRSAMLIGAGEMGELAARHLLEGGVDRLVVANRTLERADEVAQRFGAEATDLVRLDSLLAEVDIIICSTGAESFVLTKEQILKISERRRYRPLFIIDISVPRQIDPGIGEIDNVYLFDMDDLERVVASNVKEREREATVAESIVDAEVANFYVRLRTNDIGPTVVELKDRLNDVAEKEYVRLRRRLGDLTPEQEEAIRSVLLPSIINKISHPIIAHMRDSAQSPQDLNESVSVWRRIFRLGGGNLD